MLGQLSVGLVTTALTARPLDRCRSHEPNAKINNEDLIDTNCWRGGHDLTALTGSMSARPIAP